MLKQMQVNIEYNNGFLVELQFDKECKIDFLPIVVDGLGIRLADKHEKTEILSGFSKRNESLANGEWEKKWQEFCYGSQRLYDAAAQSYGKEQTEDAKQWFAHYLDCEAHSDVWRVLFSTWNKTNI